MKSMMRFHRWVGRGLAALLLVAALTGAGMQWLQPLPDEAPAAAGPSLQAQADALDRGLATLQATRPDLQWRLVQLGRSTLQVELDDTRGKRWRAELAAADGRLLAVVGEDALLGPWLVRLHLWQWLGVGGFWLTGLVACLALCSTAVGLRLWWRLRRTRAPQLRRRWHRRVGIVALMPLALLFGTAAALSWPGAVRAAIVALGGQPAMEIPVAPVRPDLARVSAGQALLNAAAALPEARPQRLYRQAPGLLRLRLRGEEWHPYGLSQVFVAEQGGGVVAVRDGRQLPLVERYVNVIFSLHAGAVPPWGGPTTALLMRLGWTALALSLAALLLTGLPWRQRKLPR
ncbi:PepSY-associated TM helix domain-containing protein [Pelomonas sp. KK5]|uniref:PepSY-associated TM helix domain-containing protein n=1 Tax=Pelomonas sp. KK5 TaxID=1855730 RepID=UPI0009FA350B|nr:PepSY-associated TM helix domain-containing protein [Pelomonas sp. KK5]